VDGHCHPATAEFGAPVDQVVLGRHGRALLAAGVLLVRVPGRRPDGRRRPGPVPTSLGAVTAGRAVAVAVAGRFFPGWGRQVPVDQVPAAAPREAARHGWANLIADWSTDDGEYALAIPAPVMAETVRQALGPRPPRRGDARRPGAAVTLDRVGAGQPSVGWP
jgi:hypothetical protein